MKTIVTHFRISKKYKVAFLQSDFEKNTIESIHMLEFTRVETVEAIRSRRLFPIGKGLPTSHIIPYH